MIDGHENDGPSKCPGMKLTDMKMQDMFQVSEYVRRHWTL